MNRIRKVIAAVVLCSLALGLQAATKTWVGPADGSWSTNANWSPSGVPASDDTAVFTTGAAVDLPAAFAGTLSVSAAVTVRVASDMHVTAAVAEGGVLTKTGNGVLTLQARAGINPGELVVASGNAVLTGHDFDFGQAPGAFGTVTVKAGAGVSVANSPAATRHGGVYQFGKTKDVAYSDGRHDTYGYLTYDQTYAQYCMAYASVSNVDATVRYFGTLEPAEGESFHRSPCIFQDQLNELGSKGAFGYARALFLGARTVTSDHVLSIVPPQNNLCLSWFVNAARVSGGWPAIDASNPSRANLAHSVAVRTGWNEFAVNYIPDLGAVSTAASPRSPSFAIKRNTPHGDDVEDLLVSDRLWNGVCCDALKVEGGASFSVPAGQAFAVAKAQGCELAGGSVSGGDGAVFMIGGAYYSTPSVGLSLAAFDSFAGQVELGRTAIVTMQGSAANVSYELVGKGTVAYGSGLFDRLSETAFVGTIRIAAGETVAVPEAFRSHVAFDGAGAVSGADAKRSPLTEVVTDGQTKSFTTDNVLPVTGESLPGYGDISAWGYFKGSSSISIPTPKNSPWVRDNACPRVDADGRLVLNDISGYQYNSVFLTNVLFHADDEWEISFKCRSWLNPDYSEKDTTTGEEHGITKDDLSGMLYFGFKPSQTKDFIRAGAWNVSILPASFCGFCYGGWVGSSRAASSVFNGIGQGALFGAADSGLVGLTQPLQVTLRGVDGKMYVTVASGAFQTGFTCDLSAAFGPDGAAQFGLLGKGDGNQADVTKLWAYQEIWDFKGFISRAAKRDEGVVPPGLEWTEHDNWKTANRAAGSYTTPLPEWEGEQTLVLSHNKDEDKFSTVNYVTSKTGVPANRPFRFAFDFTSTRTQTGNATGSDQRFYAYVQTEGPDVVFGTCDNKTSAGMPKSTPVVGLYHGSYGSPILNWTCPEGAAATTAKMEGDPLMKVWANKTNHVEIVYDGLDRVDVAIDFPDGSSVKSSKRYAMLTDGTMAGKSFYPTIVAAKDFGCGNIRIMNLAFEELSVPDPATYAAPLRVSADASATFSVGPLSQCATLNLSLGDVTLESGAQLTLAKDAIGNAVEIACLDCADGCSVTAAADMTFVLGSLRTAGSATDPLALLGSVRLADGFTVTLPRTAAKNGSVLIDASGATVLGMPSPETIRVYDLEGNELSANGRKQVIYRDGKFLLAGKGLLLIVR